MWFTQTVPKGIVDGRRKALYKWPYGASILYNLTPVPTEQMPFAIGVDQYWRLFYNPKLLAQQTPDQTAVDILHDVSHLMFRHYRRGQHILGSNPTKEQARVWHYAADLAANYGLRLEGVVLEDRHLTPEAFGFPGGLTTEQYYELLQQMDPQERDEKAGYDPSQDGEGEQDGKGKDGEGKQPGQYNPTGPGGGSAADGQPRPWEGEPPTDEDDEGFDGLGTFARYGLIRKVAEKILSKSFDHSRGPGAHWTNEILDPPVDPSDKIANKVRKAVDIVSGQGDYSYRRPSRRSPSPDILMAGNVQPMPRLTMLIDTSGSMDKTDTALALGTVAKVVNRFHLRGGLQVYCGDTSLHTSQKVFSGADVKLAGGGGTEMGELIEQIASDPNKKNRPQMIIVVTDAATDWPKKKLDIPVLACITRNYAGDSDGWIERIPKWIDRVILPGLPKVRGKKR